MRCSADDEKEILGLLSHGLEHVSVYKVASARRLGGCASGLISKPILNATAAKRLSRVLPNLIGANA